MLTYLMYSLKANQKPSKVSTNLWLESVPSTSISSGPFQNKVLINPRASLIVRAHWRVFASSRRLTQENLLLFHDAQFKATHIPQHEILLLMLLMVWCLCSSSIPILKVKMVCSGAKY